MISRRLLRIKVMQVLYAHFNTEDKTVNQSEKELLHSINKSYDLYIYLFQLVIEIGRYAESRMEIARNKQIPTFEDLHPNNRFIDNEVFKIIQALPEFQSYLVSHKMSWVNYPELIKKLYNDIIDSEYYKTYMHKKDHSLEDDKKLLVDIFANHVAFCEDLYSSLEEQSIYWNDDVEFVLSMNIKTIKSLPSKNSSKSLMTLYKNDDDKEFVKKLFRYVILHHEENVVLIDKYVKNWDIERVAFMDILIMSIAISEIIAFPGIPVKVSFNEYIELSKYYSTSKSSVFINGILDKIIQDLREQDKIVKRGRGLIGEI